MPLSFTVLRCPNSVAPETRSIAGGEFTVGRGPGVDWVLPDPERLLSKHHFAVAYRGGEWQIADTSTNGTMMNAEQEPIGRGRLRTLRNGDRLKLGAYEIEVRLTDDAQHAAGGGNGFGARPGDSPFADPFGGDPFAPPPAPPAPFGDPGYPSSALPGAAQLPPDFDPLAPDPGEEPFHATQPDHSSLMEDAFRPPTVTGHAALHAGGKLPGDDLLPDDWDNDLLAGITPAGAPAVPAAPIAAPGAFAPPPAEPLQAPHAPERLPPAGPAANPFDEPFDLTPPEQPPAVAPEPAPLARPEAASPFDQPFEAPAPAQRRAAPAPAPPPAPVAAPQAPPAAADAALLTAFLEGAGLPDARPADPAATMQALGQAFRAMVSGLRAVLIARASVKSEFRIEQTMIRARGNNPLKFSAGDDDALAALLGVGRRTDMTAEAAAADALKDIRLHELASMAAMQAAVRAMLQGLDPATLRAQAEGGGLSLLPAQRKARAWDAYEALHARTLQALSDDFDSVFGKAFARAYEQAMDEVSAKERR